jgi:poly(A) polymerase
MIKPVRISGEQFGLSPESLPASVREVLDTLKQKGFEAYLVGGSVRDFIQGLQPKDFDIATDAHPEKIKPCFRRCILIGKRFRLAHVYIKEELFEVATFRQNHSEDKTDVKGKTQDGMIVRDNVYGTLETDAIRRDLTMNALYYDMHTNEIIDFFGGVDDLKNKIIRFIGEPAERLVEDPVRALRVLRFASKLSLPISTPLQKTLHEHIHLLSNIPAARFFEEYKKLFLLGCAATNFAVLEQYNVLHYFFPSLHDISKTQREFISIALHNTDKRLSESKTVHPIFLVSVFLWHGFTALQKQLATKGPAFVATQKAMKDIMSTQEKAITFPGHFREALQDIWLLQYPLEARRKDHITRILAQRKFRAAFDFLLMRCEIGEVDPEIGAWWEKIQTLYEDDRQKMVDALA